MSKNYKTSTKNVSCMETDESVEKSVKTSKPIKTNKFQQLKISSIIYNSQSDEHISYEAYKAAGEYWNTYPKTDYTYSRLSPHRREIAPGVLAMPNMSRKSLANHYGRIELMVQQNTSQEMDIERRYNGRKSLMNISSSKFIQNVDSRSHCDRSDVRHYWVQNYRDIKNHNETMRASMVDLVFTSFATFMTLLKIMLTNDDKDTYLNNPKESTGLLNILRHRALQCFRPIYFLTASTLYVDTAVLSSLCPRNYVKKSFFVTMTMLWFLLFLSGLQIVDIYLNSSSVYSALSNIFYHALVKMVTKWKIRSAIFQNNIK